MDTNKTLGYDWEYGHEEVAIRVSSYRNNGNLYVGLCHREEGEWEDFGDVTINLPFSFLEPNEAYITGDFTKDMIRFIKAHKLGKVLDETASLDMEPIRKWHLTLQGLQNLIRRALQNIAK